MVYDGKHVTEFTYNEMNELTGITHPDTSTETLTYDNNGNLTQTTNNTTGDTTTYEWDCFDRLKKVTLPAKGGGTAGEIVEFSYDSDGMLVKQKDVTVPAAGGSESQGIERKFIQHNRYATRELVKNSKGEWETTANHIIHNRMLSSYIHSNSMEAGNKTDTIFYHTDHLGSVRLITDTNGNPIDKISTDAYGNPLPHADSSGNKPAKILQTFNFIGTHGIRYVEKVKLHNMRARWYGGRSKRFLSEDIYENFNKYFYPSNPVLYIDPTGKIQLFHLFGKDKRFQKFDNSGIPLVNAKLNYDSLSSVMFHSKDDHTILYIYTHAALSGFSAALGYMKYLVGFVEGLWPFPDTEVPITWKILTLYLKKREEEQVKSYQNGNCYKFLWVVANACGSAHIVPEIDDSEVHKDAKQFLNFVDNSNTIIYSGWNNWSAFNSKMNKMITDIYNRNMGIGQNQYEVVPGGHSPAQVIHFGHIKHGKNVTGEWFKKDKNWW